MRRPKFAELVVFAAVAESLSFRTAACHLGLTPSAVSHAIRQLEERLGLRLLHRTTRSVALTDAGQRMIERVRPAIDQIRGAVEDLAHEGGSPRGRLRLYCPPLIAMAVIAPVWARFLSTYPEVHLDLEVGEKPIDIVEGGFDAAIGLQSWGDADMVAVRVSGPFRAAYVGSPAYFSQRRPPGSPEELSTHCCIRYGPDLDLFGHRWRFQRGAELREVAIAGQVTVNSPDVALRAALDGLGIAVTTEAQAEAFLRSGQLIRVLPEWSLRLPGFFLHYPGHRQVPAPLRAFIDVIRATSRKEAFRSEPALRLASG